MPVRKIPRSGGSITGRVARYGGVGSIGHESFLEHDFVFLSLFAPEVADVEEQPAKIFYNEADAVGDRRKQRRCFPDYLVTYHDWAKRPPMLVEVKCCALLNRERAELLPKIRAGRSYARARGWRYRVFTEKSIRGALLTNVRFLLPYRRFKRDETRCRRLLDALSPLGHAQVDRLLDVCCGQGVSEERGKHIACLWWLLAARELAADLTVSLSMSTDLWREKPLLCH